MAHAEVCPICHGEGKLPNDPSTTVNGEKICHGCNGRGWIIIPDSKYPPFPYPTPFPFYPKPTPYFNPYIIYFG